MDFAARPLLAADAVAGPATELTPSLAEFQKLRFGCSFSFGTATFTGNDYDVGSEPATVYDPTNLDVRQWIRVAREMGAKYAVLTVKHMSGFCLWPAKGYDYTVAQSGNKTDVVAAFVAACREYGLRAGFYYCILDPHNERKFPPKGTILEKDGKFNWDAPVSDEYFQLIRSHITQMYSTYPNTFYQLFDIPWILSPEQRRNLYRLVKSYNPDCIVVNNQGFAQSRNNQGRLCESGSWPTDVVNGEDTLPPLEGHDPHIIYEKKTYYLPFETWLPTGPIYPSLRYAHTWFWHPGYKPQSPQVIAESYRICMEHNANLLLNLAPDRAGRIPEDQVETCRRVTELIRSAKC